MAITYQRAGETVACWTGGGNVSIKWKAAPARASDNIHLNFTMGSAGGGNTQVRVNIPPEDFAAIAQAMMNVDPEAARKAFGEALIIGQETTSASIPYFLKHGTSTVDSGPRTASS